MPNFKFSKSWTACCKDVILIKQYRYIFFALHLSRKRFIYHITLSNELNNCTYNLQKISLHVKFFNPTSHFCPPHSNYRYKYKYAYEYKFEKLFLILILNTLPDDKTLNVLNINMLYPWLAWSVCWRLTINLPIINQPLTPHDQSVVIIE